MFRSLPEKTLEHWCSMHLTFRFKTHLRLWWPTRGEDINVSGGPLAPGKRFWLELKTTAWNPKAKRHELTIDLDQLDAYGRSSTPDFYVFITPSWVGHLTDSPAPTWRGSFDPTDFAFQTHTGSKWFTKWTYVIPGNVLRRLVAARPGTPAAKKSPKKTKRTLRIAEIAPNGMRARGKITWKIPAPTKAEFKLWRDFWTTMQTCGDDGDFAAEFVLPITASLPKAGAKHAQLLAAMKDAQPADKKLHKSAKEREAELIPRDKLRLWSPADGVFASTDAATAAPAGDDFVWGAGTERGIVLMTASGLEIP